MSADSVAPDGTPTPVLPFAAAATLYLDAGWQGVLPIPARRKSSPPDGFTGNSGAWPTEVQLDAWRRDRPDGNIALRMPPDVIGIDVDDYGTKKGGETFNDCLARWGPLPPTWISTSRDDGISGIRFYRIPAGIRLIGALPDVEIIQNHHRYAVVAPSIHPEGRRYRWVDPDGCEAEVAHVEDLPELPEEWLTGLRSDNKTTEIRRAARTGGLTTSPAVERALGRALSEMRVGTRHDAALDAVGALARLEERGHPGATEAIDQLGAMFVAAIAPDRGERQAQGEWERMREGARDLVASTPAQVPEWEERAGPPRFEDVVASNTGNATTSNAAEGPGGDSDQSVPSDDSFWTPTDLRAVLAGAIPTPTPTILRVGAKALLYPGRSNSLFGESGSGKTWIMLAAVVEVVIAGGTVLIIDYEDTVGGIIDRLRSLGLDDETIASRVIYIEGRVGWSPVAQAALSDLVRTVELVCIDSVGEAMAAGGVKGNDDDDVARWFVNFPKWIARRGPAVLLIDHVPKDPNAPTTYAIGSQRKMAAIDGASYRVDPIRVPTRTENGSLSLTTAKDRHGHHQKGTQAARVDITHQGDGAVGIALTTTATEALDGSGRFIPTYVMEQISRFLEANPGANKRAVRDGVKGKAKVLDEALGELITAGHVDLDSSKRGFSYVVTTPYREPDELDVLMSSDDVPKGSVLPCPTVSFHQRDTRVPVSPSPTGTRTRPGVEKRPNVSQGPDTVDKSTEEAPETASESTRPTAPSEGRDGMPAGGAQDHEVAPPSAELEEGEAEHDRADSDGFSW